MNKRVITNGRPPQQPAGPFDYPILTESLDSSSPSAPAYYGAAGSPTRVAADTIRQVLGWRYRTEDIKGFQAALAKSFAPRPRDDDYTEYVWNRQNAVAVDDAEITGALSSLYTRAKVAVDQAVPLLDSLKPLRPDADPENTEAMRNIVRDNLLLLPSIIGTAGGPLPVRVDLAFKNLLGDNPARCHADPERVEGDLKKLRQRFGLDRRHVNTIDEELNLTNFLTLVDYVASLHQTWKSQARFFERGKSGTPFLGNQAVLIRRQLEVVADSVQRARSVMDSVYFGRAEQEADFLQPIEGQAPFTVAELLDWVLAATQLTPDQLQSKDSLAALAPVLDQVHTLVHAVVLHQRDTTRDEGAEGFYSERVQLAFASLDASLASAKELAAQIGAGPAPQIAREFNAIVQAERVYLAIRGAGFEPGAQAELYYQNDPPLAGTVVEVTRHSVYTRFELTNAALGPWGVRVINPDRQKAEADGRVLVLQYEQPAPPPVVAARAASSAKKSTTKKH